MLLELNVVFKKLFTSFLRFLRLSSSSICREFNGRGEKEEEPRPSNYTKVTEEEEGKYSWEYDDQGYGALEAFFDDIVHKVGPEISLEDAKGLIGSRGKGGDDTKAFDMLMSTFRLPKKTEQDDKYRSKQILKMSKHVTDIPFKTLKKSVELMDLSNDAIELGNHNCISDAGVAAEMAYSCA